MYETDNDTIKKIFYERFSELTRRANSFDFQFSGRWTNRLDARSASKAPL